MANRNIAWKIGKHRGHKNFFHLAHRAMRVQFANDHQVVLEPSRAP